VNKTRDGQLRRAVIVFDRPMILIAATLTLLCLSNAFLCVQSQRLRAELLNLRSTVSAVEARPGPSFSSLCAGRKRSTRPPRKISSELS
jgi:hypothetical protein